MGTKDFLGGGQVDQARDFFNRERSENSEISLAKCPPSVDYDQSI